MLLARMVLVVPLAAGCAGRAPSPIGDDEAPPAEAPDEPCVLTESWPSTLLDPNFDEGGIWRIEGGFESGTGVVQLSEAAVAAQTVSIAQTIEMPPLCVVGGATIEEGLGSDVILFQAAAPVRLNDMVVAPLLGRGPTRLCLGERAFDRTVEVNLVAYGLGAFSVDRLAIEQEPLCPQPGDVLPFTFEGPLAWTQGGVSVVNGAPVEGTISIEDGVLHLGTDSFCAYPQVQGPEIGAFSVPDVDNAALALTVRGTAWHNIDGSNSGPWLRLGEQYLADIFPNDTETIVCLPAALRGAASRLGFQLGQPFRTSVGPGCDPSPQDVFISDVRIVRDERCGGPITDGSFDDAAPTWRFFGDARLAAQGDGNEAQLVGCGPLQEGYVSTVITVPEPEPGAGPALRFQYTHDGIDGASFSVGAPIVSGFAELAPASTMTEALFCLDPHRRGEAIDVEWRLSGGSNGCNGLESHARIDDVVVDTDPRCPAL